MTYEYGYDGNGNITAENLTIAPETEDGSSDDGTNQAVSYEYDEKNQLIKATSSTTEWSYEYDSRGNIISKSIRDIDTDDTLTYTYCYDSVWKDRLVSYNNELISYEKRDENGVLAANDPSNPLIYRGNVLTWTMGRQLAEYRITNGTETQEDDTVYSYTYNEDGIRTSKTVDNVKTEFYLDGTNIIEQITGTDVIHFYYDSSDEVIGFKYNGNNYFYVKNLQGDVTDIVYANGEIVSSYAYDPWGDVLYISGNTEIGNINPFRYRSYYYDADLGLYYLQSRYYDPEIGRFINSDDVSFIGATGSEISYNPFAYCENNPILYTDYNGNSSVKVNIKIRHIKYYVYVYRYDTDIGHVDISIDGTTYSYGTYMPNTTIFNKLITKIRGKAQGCFSIANTKKYIQNMKKEGSPVNGVAKIGLTEDEYIALNWYFILFLLINTNGTNVTKDKDTSRFYVIRGKYAYYSYISANCSTFVRDALYACMPEMVEIAISRAFIFKSYNAVYTPNDVFALAKEMEG